MVEYDIVILRIIMLIVFVAGIFFGYMLALFIEGAKNLKFLKKLSNFNSEILDDWKYHSDERIMCQNHYVTLLNKYKIRYVDLELLRYEKQKTIELLEDIELLKIKHETKIL